MLVSQRTTEASRADVPSPSHPEWVLQRKAQPLVQRKAPSRTGRSISPSLKGRIGAPRSQPRAKKKSGSDWLSYTTAFESGTQTDDVKSTKTQPVTPRHAATDQRDAEKMNVYKTSLITPIKASPIRQVATTSVHISNQEEGEGPQDFSDKAGLDGTNVTAQPENFNDAFGLSDIPENVADNDIPEALMMNEGEAGESLIQVHETVLHALAKSALSLGRMEAVSQAMSERFEFLQRELKTKDDALQALTTKVHEIAQPLTVVRQVSAPIPVPAPMVVRQSSPINMHPRPGRSPSPAMSGRHAAMPMIRQPIPVNMQPWPARQPSPVRIQSGLAMQLSPVSMHLGCAPGPAPVNQAPGVQQLPVSASQPIAVSQPATSPRQLWHGQQNISPQPPMPMVPHPTLQAIPRPPLSTSAPGTPRQGSAPGTPRGRFRSSGQASLENLPMMRSRSVDALPGPNSNRVVRLSSAEVPRNIMVSHPQPLPLTMSPLPPAPPRIGNVLQPHNFMAMVVPQQVNPMMYHTSSNQMLPPPPSHLASVQAKSLATHGVGEITLMKTDSTPAGSELSARGTSREYKVAGAARNKQSPSYTGLSSPCFDTNADPFCCETTASSERAPSKSRSKSPNSRSKSPSGSGRRGGSNSWRRGSYFGLYPSNLDSVSAKNYGNGYPREAYEEQISESVQSNKRYRAPFKC